MTSIVASADDLDAEAAGETSLELVAVRYTGPRTLYDVEAHLVPAGWPGSVAIDGGPTPAANGSWNLVLMPDSGLAALEGRPDLEVVYADQQAEFAQILLEETDLPENVFGRNADQELQQRVFDLLGLEPTAQGGPFEDQLRSLVGSDAEPEPEPEDEGPEDSLVAELANAYDRNTLGDIAKRLREDPSEFNLRENAKKTERAEYIATFDRQERAAAVDAVTGGSE